MTQAAVLSISAGGDQAPFFSRMQPEIQKMDTLFSFSWAQIEFCSPWSPHGMTKIHQVPTLCDQTHAEAFSGLGQCITIDCSSQRSMCGVGLRKPNPSATQGQPKKLTGDPPYPDLQCCPFSRFLIGLNRLRAYFFAVEV